MEIIIVHSLHGHNEINNLNSDVPEDDRLSNDVQETVLNVNQKQISFVIGSLIHIVPASK